MIKLQALKSCFCQKEVISQCINTTYVDRCCLILAFRNSSMATLAATGGGAQTKVPGLMIGWSWKATRLGWFVETGDVVASYKPILWLKELYIAGINPTRNPVC